MSNKIWKFTCPWNKSTLLAEFDSSTAQTVSSYNPTWKKTWNIGSHGTSIKNSFSENTYVGYYWQQAGTEVKSHTDTVANCRINIVLSGDDEVLHIGDSDITYDCALINVSQYEHSVDSASSDRLMLSICFYEDDFASIKNVLQTYSYP